MLLSSSNVVAGLMSHQRTTAKLIVARRNCPHSHGEGPSLPNAVMGQDSCQRSPCGRLRQLRDSYEVKGRNSVSITPPMMRRAAAGDDRAVAGPQSPDQPRAHRSSARWPRVKAQSCSGLSTTLRAGRFTPHGPRRPSTLRSLRSRSHPGLPPWLIRSKCASASVAKVRVSSAAGMARPSAAASPDHKGEKSPDPCASAFARKARVRHQRAETPALHPRSARSRA
jgi:hypothetical protein